MTYSEFECLLAWHWHWTATK